MRKWRASAVRRAVVTCWRVQGGRPPQGTLNGGLGEAQAHCEYLRSVGSAEGTATVLILFNVISGWMVRPTKPWQARYLFLSLLCFKVVFSWYQSDTAGLNNYCCLESLEWAVSSVRSLIQAVEMFKININIPCVIHSCLIYHSILQWPALECHT